MFSLRYHFLITLTVLILVSLLFFYLPHIDIRVSRYFFVKEYTKTGLIGFSTRLVSWLVIVTCVISTLVFSVAWITKQKKIMIAALFILLCFGLGPGLIVNGILKADWGRPRPHQTESVSASAVLPYVRVWTISDECHSNCSFVAGDSSAALTFIAFAFLPLASRWKRIIVTVSLCYFSYNGILRIISGAHYLSDVLIGGLLIYLIILGCYQVCFGYLEPRIK